MTHQPNEPDRTEQDKVQALADKMKVAAEAATKGQWFVTDEGRKNSREVTVFHAGDDLNYIASCRDHTCFHEPPRNVENAVHIAASNPANVLTILADRARQEEENNALKVENVNLRIAFDMASESRETFFQQVATLTAKLAECEGREKGLRDEVEQLRLAICGGEDAPGYAMGLPLEAILDVARQNTASWFSESDRATTLDWLAENQNCELSYGYEDEDDDGSWRVHRVNGGRNDREWTLIGTGETPEAAIRAALSDKAGA